MTTKRQGQENRRTPRVETAKGLWVAWRTDGSPSVCRVRDLSLGGVFIATRTPLGQGSAIKLLFSLPEGEMRIEGTAVGMRVADIIARPMELPGPVLTLKSKAFT